MANYHINPKTGNANLCRAKLGKCPYEKDFAEHYETKIEAQKAYEDQMENPVSEMSKLLLLRYRTQSKILGMFFSEDYSEITEDEQQKINALADRRRKLDKAISETKKDELNKSDAGTPRINDPLKMKQPILKRDNNLIIGFSNTIEDIQKEQPGVWEDLEKASTEWLQRCSSVEVKSIRDYADGSEDYAKNSEVNNKNEIDTLHDALRKSPKFDKPMPVFSGLSFQTRDIVMSQSPKAGSTITLNRALSTSVNPAQASGFMTHNYKDLKNLDKEKNVALEIETDNGGVMTVASNAAHEFEILLLPAEYEVLEVKDDVQFAWGEKEDGTLSKGVKADILIRVKKVKDLEI